MPVVKLMHTILLSLLLYSTFNFGCGTPMPNDCQHYYSMPMSRREEVLRSYSIDKQYQIFRCGMENIQPQDKGPAFIIAERGEQVIPFLLEKIETENGDAVGEILLVFQVLSEEGYLQRKEDVMTRLEQRVASIENRYAREQAHKRLLEIQANITTHQH